MAKDSIQQTTTNTNLQKRRKEEIKADPLFRNFINSIKSPITKQGYTQALFRFYLSRPENINLSLSQILQKEQKKIEYELIDMIFDMKEKHKLAYSTIHSTLAAVTHFFEINDVPINKKKLNKFKGENISKFEYRSYTHDEIHALLQVLDERARAFVLLMASTGMRVGALPDLKLKHLKRWELSNNSNDHVYQITVYSSSPKHKYQTFCTPEAAKAIDTYLEYRKRCGDKVRQDMDSKNWGPDNSYLFVRNFGKEVQDMFNLSLTDCFSLPINSRTYTRTVIMGLRQIGQREKIRLVEEQAPTESEKRSNFARHKNEIHPCHSLRIFAVTNMQRAKLDKTIREMLVGHSTGLDKSYYKPQDDEILQEYLKAVNYLTIDKTFKLEQQLKAKVMENDLYKKEIDSLKEYTEKRFEAMQRLVNTKLGND